MTEAMQRAIDIKPALDRLVVNPQHNSSRGPKLKQFKLTDQEWSFVSLLNKILQVCGFYFIVALFICTYIVLAELFEDNTTHLTDFDTASTRSDPSHRRPHQAARQEDC